MRDSAQRSVQNAAEGGTKVQQGMDVVTRSGEMFGEITDVIEILVREIGEVATATQQLAAGGRKKWVPRQNSNPPLYSRWHLPRKSIRSGRFGGRADSAV